MIPNCSISWCKRQGSKQHHLLITVRHRMHKLVLCGNHKEYFDNMGAEKFWDKYRHDIK